MRPAFRSESWAVFAAASLLVAACGDSSTSESKAVEPPAARGPLATEPPAAHASYELHRWSFVAFDPEPASVSRAVSAPHRADTLPTLSASYAVDGPSAVYLRRASPEGPSTNVSVRLVSGNGTEPLERWPRISGRVDAWNDVVVRRGPCPPAIYPSATDEVCDTADARCDSSDAREHEAPDADCISNDSIAARQLSFRTSLARSRIPYDLRSTENGVVLRSLGISPERPRIVRVVRGATAGSIRIAQFDAPTDDESVAIPEVSGDPVDPVAALIASIESSGLTTDERAAFARAIGPRVVGDSAPRDAVYYFVPKPTVESLVPVESLPAPSATSAVLLVRLSLDPYVRPPRSRDPEPTLRVRTDGLPTVSGGSVDSHRRVVLEHIEDLEACATAAYRPGRMIAERLVVRYQVASNGVVRSAIVDDPVGSNRLVVACVESAFLTFTFPESRSPVALGRIPLSILALPPR